MSNEIVKGVGWEDGGAVFMARIRNWSATNITQASVTGITYQVTDLATGSTIDSGSLTPADVIYDSLQTPDIWEADDTGYNFRHDAPATWFPSGDRPYRIEFTIDPSSGADFQVPFEMAIGKIYKS